MSTETARRERDDHDWHSLEYVDEWIARDVGRERERRPLLDWMMSFAGFAGDVPLQVLDLAAGYGAVTDAVMRAFPLARVTLQDFSREMLDRAHEHLSPRFSDCRYICCDLSDPAWIDAVGRPYDLAVSAIGIHNLADFDKIRRCYRGVAAIMADGGPFLNCDYFVNTGGVDLHQRSLRDVGFSKAECVFDDGKRAIIKALR